MRPFLFALKNQQKVRAKPNFKQHSKRWVLRKSKETLRTTTPNGGSASFAEANLPGQEPT